MDEFSCWFCDRVIDRSDPGAVLIHLRSFWCWFDGSSTEDRPTQDVYAHSGCAKDRLVGARMTLDPSIFEEGD